MIAKDVTTQPVNFVLVHGTFARDAEWIQHDSTFSSILRSQFPNSRFFPFNWTGRNSHSARIEAGKHLANLLHSIRHDYPDENCFVIAHSHGGNVVLYALSASLDVDGCDLVDGCVFLGTPFLMTQKREIELFISTLAFQLSWLCPWALLGVGLIVAWGEKGLIAWLAGLPLVTMLVVAIWGERLLTAPIRQNLLTILLAKQRSFYDRITPRPLSVPSLVCNVQRDEARGWLGTLNLASGSAFTASDHLLEFIYLFPLLFLLGMFGYVIDWLVGERNAFFIEGLLLSMVLMLVGTVAVVVAALVMPSLSVLFRGHSAGFGWEGFLGYSVVDIDTALEPTQRAKGIVSTLNYEIGHAPYHGLRHSQFYADKSLVKAVADWIESRVRNPRLGVDLGPGISDKSPSLAKRVASRPSVRLSKRRYQHPTPRVSEISAPRSIARLLASIASFSAFIAAHLIRRPAFLLLSASVLLGLCWTVWPMFHHIRDLPPELQDFQASRGQGLFALSGARVGFFEDWKFSGVKPPGQCYLVGHYKTDSVNTLVLVFLASSTVTEEIWKFFKGSSFCPLLHSPEKELIYSSEKRRREATFGRKVDASDGGFVGGCVVVRNSGKVPSSHVDLELSLACLAPNR